jgi:hypothetical protein
MVGRPGKPYLPLPICSAGHKRTQMNTAWVMHRINGREYLLARCRLCEAAKRKIYYEHHRKRRLMEAAE